jgi:hypothetical protein
MLQSEVFITQLTTCGKQIKFTPERIQQIKNLIERGKSQGEIAELIGVTVSSLQVTCSKLGISLRQPIFRTRAGLLERNGPYSTNRTVSNRDSSAPIGPVKELPKQNSETGRVEEAQAPSPAQERTHEIELAKLSLRMQYRGSERITELPLTQDMIRQLAFEAQFRGMCIGRLVGEIIVGIAKQDLFQEMLEQLSSES